MPNDSPPGLVRFFYPFVPPFTSFPPCPGRRAGRKSLPSLRTWREEVEAREAPQAALRAAVGAGKVAECLREECVLPTPAGP